MQLVTLRECRSRSEQSFVFPWWIKWTSFSNQYSFEVQEGKIGKKATMLDFACDFRFLGILLVEGVLAPWVLQLTIPTWFWIVPWSISQQLHLTLILWTPLLVATNQTTIMAKDPPPSKVQEPPIKKSGDNKMNPFIADAIQKVFGATEPNERTDEKNRPNSPTKRIYSIRYDSKEDDVPKRKGHRLIAAFFQSKSRSSTRYGVQRGDSYRNTLDRLRKGEDLK